ncbi:hypothetical protein LZ30DRAFT_723543 [Colletotrichum cereale]|nr:hypothetical protein LZ30DRAFT_723543 [Colletotrichum cereale]
MGLLQNFARSRRMNCGLGLVSRQVSCRPSSPTLPAAGLGAPLRALFRTRQLVSTVDPGLGVGHGTTDGLRDRNLYKRFRRLGVRLLFHIAEHNGHWPCCFTSDPVLDSTTRGTIWATVRNDRYPSAVLRKVVYNSSGMNHLPRAILQSDLSILLIC